MSIAPDIHQSQAFVCVLLGLGMQPLSQQKIIAHTEGSMLFPPYSTIAPGLAQVPSNLAFFGRLAQGLPKCLCGARFTFAVDRGLDDRIPLD